MCTEIILFVVMIHAFVSINININCNYGIAQIFGVGDPTGKDVAAFVADKCQFMHFAADPIRSFSFMVECEYNATESTAVVNYYKDVDCSGTPMNSVSVEKFRCVQDNMVDNICEIYAIKLDVFNGNLGCDGMKDGSIEYYIYPHFSESCYVTDAPLTSRKFVFRENKFVQKIYTENLHCNGKVSYEIAYPSGCSYIPDLDVTVDTKLTNVRTFKQDL